jgi:hypothetical protein
MKEGCVVYRWENYVEYKIDFFFQLGFDFFQKFIYPSFFLYFEFDLFAQPFKCTMLMDLASSYLNEAISLYLRSYLLETFENLFETKWERKRSTRIE